MSGAGFRRRRKLVQPDSMPVFIVSNKPANGGNRPESVKILIDRMTLTGNTDKNTENSIVSNGYTQVKDGRAFVNSSGKGTGYKLNLQMRLKSSKSKPFFQAGPKVPHKPSIRLDFNPSALGLDGMVEMKASLCSLIDDGYGFFLSCGHVTRIDIAVDLMGVDINQFYLIPNRTLSSSRWSKGGMPRTRWSGATCGKRICFRRTG